ncbi:MAG: hypothetical protein GY714_22285 [Desulfobacterales bacterium]|nr:hypothetical protein [Desulfobacterales bacterium]
MDTAVISNNKRYSLPIESYRNPAFIASFSSIELKIINSRNEPVDSRPIIIEL